MAESCSVRIEASRPVAAVEKRSTCRHAVDLATMVFGGMPASLQQMVSNILANAGIHARCGAISSSCTRTRARAVR